MKPALPLFVLLFFCNSVTAQSLDYISVRKKNGRVVKNIYTRSQVLLQTRDSRYWEGPVEAIRNDSVYLMIYDIRVYPTVWGSRIRDTITKTLLGLHHHDIERVYLNTRPGFVRRTAGPLLMLAGGGYFAVNVLNGTLFNGPVFEGENGRRLGIAAGLFGLGFLFRKLFTTDGFSKKNHRIVYVDLSLR